MKYKLLTFIGLLFLAVSTFAQTPTPPVLLYTDIVTGAKTGGEGGNGVYLTIYGKGFGATQGSSTVTVGGGAVASYKIWGQNNDITTRYDMIVVQIGASAATGNIVVTVGGHASNTLPFTVSAGNIYFVSNSGSDATAGTFAAPWLTVAHAKTVMVAGDTLYVRAGTYTTIDDNGAIILCNGACQGTATQYQNFLGYPGEYPTWGDASTVRTIYHWGGGTWNYATFGELTLRGTGEAFTCQNTTDACNFIRIVGSDVRATNGGSTALDIEDGADHMSWLGNESAHNCTTDGVTVDPACTFDNRSYSSYVGGYGAITNMEIAYNRFHDNPFGKGIQIYGHQAGESLVNLLVHDNLIYNQTMTGITAGGTDGGVAWVTSVSIYNNVIYNVSNGAGQDHMNYGCINLAGIGTSDGTYQIYNNTLYDCSPAHNQGGTVQAGGVFSFGLDGPGTPHFYNNIEYGAPAGNYYYYFDDTSAPTASRMTLANNLYFNLGTGPSGGNGNVGSITVPSETGKVNADPKFTSSTLPAPTLSLQTTSPALGAGTHTGAPTLDFVQNTRPNPPSMGAFDVGTVTPPVAPIVSFSPASISFGNQTTGIASSPQTITVTNTGNANLTFSSNATLSGANPGDFSVSAAGTCKNAVTVAPAATCTIVPTFTPLAVGARSATVSISDNASGSPHTAALSGTGLATSNQIIVNCPATANCKVVGQITMTTGVATLPASVSIAPANGSVPINGTFPLVATVLNDPSHLGVIWTVTGSNCTGAACGVISPTTSMSGAIVTYTAPPTSPVGAVVITASAVSNQSSFQSNITVITPMPPPTGPNGNNVFTSPAQVSGTTKTFNMTGFQGPSMIANFTSVTTSSAITGVQACKSGSPCVSLTFVNSIDLAGTKKTYQYRGINIGTGFTSVVVSTSDTNALNAAIFDVSSIGAFDTSVTKTASATTNPTGPSITTATANELVVCALGTTGIASNVAAPFTFDLTGGQDAGAAAVNATASAISPSWTTTNNTYAALCGAYSVGTTPPAITVVNNPTSANVQASTTRTFTAVVGNDPANQGVNWTATCGSGPCGSFSPTHTASGVATTFTAPALIPPGGSVTLLQHPKLDVSANPATIPITASTAGSTLCVFDVWNTTAGTMSVTDSKGEAWGAPIASLAQSGDSGAYDCLANNVGGVGSITVTVNGSAPTVNELYVREYSGMVTSSLVDQTAQTTTFASPMDSGFTATTTNATDLLLGFGFNGSASTFTPGTNGQGGTYANLDQQTQIGSAVMDFNTTTSTNTYKAVMTPNSASGSGIFVAALKANAGGAGNASITITATSVADPTKTAVTTVNVTAAPPPISLAVNPPSDTLTAGTGTTSITPTVSNDPAHLGVTWTLSGVGSISLMSSASGTPTVYTPPATVSSAASATITATSVSDTSKTASASILINPASGPNPPPTSGCSGGVCAAFAGAGGNAEGAGAGKSVSQPNVGASGRNGTGTPQVYLITSTADTGAGTLRGCLANAGPTFCIFRVSPTSAITQHSRLSANQPYKYVAGQTAPGGPIEIGGIGQSGEALQVQTHDVIIRYLTWDGNAGCQNITVSGGTMCSFAKATGPAAGTVGLEVAGCGTCYNIIYDHPTMRWSGNKGLLDLNNGSPSTGVTFQWGLAFEPNVAHPVITEPDSTCSGCTVIGHGPTDYHHNLVVNYDHRWILYNLGQGIMQNNASFNGLQFDDAFNVGIWGGIFLDMIGNKWVDGPQSQYHMWTVGYQPDPNKSADPADCQNGAGTGCDNTRQAKLYFLNNIAHPGSSTGSAPIAATTVANDANQKGLCQVMNTVETPHNGSAGSCDTVSPGVFVSAPTQTRLFPITRDDVTVLDAKLTPTVGNSQHLDCNGNFVSNRDSQAQRVIAQYLARGSGTMFAGLTNEPESNVTPTAVNYNGFLNVNNKQSPYWPNGIPQAPAIPTAALCTMSLNDGIYDGWKIKWGLSTTDPNLWKQTDLSSGYLYIEDFLNGIVPNAIPNSATVSKGFFGQTQLNFNNTHATATTSPGVIRLWDNSACVWPLVETARGVFNWTNCDIALNSIIAAGATPDWVWGRTPGWAITGGSGSCVGGYAPTGCANAPSDLNTGNAILREMQTALIAHLAATHPGIHWMEEGVNESDLLQEWVGAAGTLDRIADLVTLQTAIYTSAKAADPAIIVLGPSGSGINVSNIKLWTDGNSLATKAGIFAVIDGVAIHVYEQSCSTYCASPDLMEAWWPQVNTLVGVSGALHGKPVYVTEANWGGAPGPSGAATQNSTFSEATKRQYYARQTMWAFKEGVKSFMWYAFDSHPDNLAFPGFGTMCVGTPANTCVPNQAATNYATLQSWLVGATYSPNPCVTDGGGTTTCTFLTSPASTGKAAVIFNPTSTPSVTVDSSFTKVINWDGSTTPIVSHAVTAGLDPVLAVP